MNKNTLKAAYHFPPPSHLLTLTHSHSLHLFPSLQMDITGTRPSTNGTGSSRPSTPPKQPLQQQQPSSPPQAPQTAETTTQAEPSFSDSWNYWKKRQGSAEGQNRKMSSIDPLAPEVNHSIPETDPEHQVLLVQPNPTNGTLPNTTPGVSWGSYLNPLRLIPENMYHLQLPNGLNGSSHGGDNANGASDTQSDHSSTTHHSEGGWFTWIWNGDKYHDEDEDATHGSLSNAETRRLIKECKKLVQNQDTVWAWYNKPLIPGLESHGELSVMATRSETHPVNMKRYPHKTATSSPQPKDQPAVVEPSLKDCFREITTRTKVRLTTQLYYNCCKEKHLYLKRNTQTPHIRNVLVVSIVGQTGKLKHNMTANQLCDYSTESIRTWFQETNPQEEYLMQTISLEAGKLDSSTLEHLLVLLTNWRDAFKHADYIMIVGFKNTAPLTVLLMDSLISRKLVTTNTAKLGLHFIDGIIPGPYLDESETSMVSSFITYTEFSTKLSDLMYLYNVKLTILGSLSNISSSLALQLQHSNIFRTIFIPHTANYNNQFEVELFRLLLMAQNLGHSSTRLMIQLSKYFTPTNVMLFEEISSEMFIPANYHCLSTTRLLKPCPLELSTIEDPILNNNYNLIWTLHAFVDDFKSIKNIDSLKRIKSWIEAYKSWDPQTKQLKDLKYMLEVLKVEDYSGAILRES